MLDGDTELSPDFGAPKLTSDCCLADFCPRLPVNQLYNNQKMANLRFCQSLIMHSYMGPTYKAIPDHGANPLTVQLMILLFLFLGSVALIFSPVILLFEHLWMKLSRYHDPPSDNCRVTHEEKICFHCGCRQIHKEMCK